jgi:hypothetical protein
VTEGRILANRLVRLACERHLDDLGSAGTRDCATTWKRRATVTEMIIACEEQGHAPASGDLISGDTTDTEATLHDGHKLDCTASLAPRLELIFSQVNVQWTAQ